MRRLLLACALLSTACLRPFPEMDDVDLPDAGPPPVDEHPERTKFVEVPGAQGDLRFLALAAGPDAYVSDGRSVWLRANGQPVRQLALTVAGQPVEEVSGLWGDFQIPEYAPTVVAGVKAAGSWSVVQLRAGQVLWTRPFPGTEGPSAGAGSFSGIMLASSQTVAVMDRSPNGGGPDFTLPAGTARPSFALTASAGRVMFFLPADAAHPPSLFAIENYPAFAVGPTHPLAEQPEARLVEAQCGLVVGGTGFNNGVVDAVLLSTEQGPPARYQGDQTQGAWALFPAAFQGTGRCLGAAMLSTTATTSGETYAFPQALLVHRPDGAVRHEYKDFEASAAATLQDGSSSIALAGKLTATGQRGITFSTP